MRCSSHPTSVAYRGVVWGVQPPPLEIPKALQNRAKLNPIVKTVKTLPNLGRQHPQDVREKGSKILKLRRFTTALH